MRGVVMILGWIGVLGVVACAAPPTDSDPARSGYRPAYVALQGAQIVVGDGQVLSPGTLLMHRGQIVAVGAEVTLPAGTEVLDVTGMVVYPGWIDAVNDRLLTPPEEVVRGREVDAAATAVVAMRTDHHRGLTPEYEAGWSLVRDSAAYERHRRAGFSLVHVVPTGRIMSGQTAVVGLADVPPREALLQATWAQTVHLTDLGGRLYPQTLMGTLAHLRQHVLDARRWKLQMELYARGVSDVPRPAHDPVWEALVNLESRHQPLWWCVRSRDDLERVFSLADEQHWPVHVVWGVHEEITRWIPELVRRHVGVVLTLDWGEPPSLEVKTDTDDWPALAEPRRWREGQRRQWLQRAELLRQLRAQGITVALGTQGLDAPDKAWQALRRLVEHGTSPEEVLTALTLGPARLLGLEQRLGTLTPGKLAHVLVTTHPWHHPDAKVRYVFVEEERYEYHAEKSLLRTDSSPESPWKPWLGRWQLTLGSGEHVLPATLELHTQGERLTGRFSSAQGDGQVQHAKKQPQGLQFDIAIGVGDRAVVLHIEAQLPEGDPPARWHGTMRSAFGQPTSFTAVRRPEAQPSSGATLTIEAADDEPPVSALSALTTSDVGSTAGRLQVSDPPRGHCTLAADQTGLATRDALPVELPEDRRPSRPSTGGNLLLKQVSIITGTGQTLPAHDLLIRGGIITAMAPHLPAEPGVTVLELPGWFVMPGIIDTHSHIMLARGLVGVNEATDSVVCEVQVRDIINTSDPQEYRAVAGGCTTLRLLHGSANVIGGQDTIVQLRLGETIAGHLLPDAPQGVKFALGENVKARQERFPNTRMGVEATLQRAFAEALEYRHRWQQYEQALRGGQDPHSLFPPRRDLRLECLAEILSGHRFIHSHCYRADEILMLLRVAERHGIRVRSLQHVLEGYKVAPEIVEHGSSCSTFADWWAYKVEAYDAVPHNAAVLHRAGANVVIKSDDAELMRHLYYEAAKPVRYGSLPLHEAPALITRNAARELGIADRWGTLEVGKQGDVAIFNGHPLNSWSRCEGTIIGGEIVFWREDQPSAMTEASWRRSRTAPEVPLPPRGSDPPPLDLSPAMGQRVALVGASIHPVDAPQIPRGVVLIEDGRIVQVQPGDAVPADWPVLSLEGLQLYPGLIDAGSTLGLTEIRRVLETHDFEEVGEFQPDVQAAVAVNPDSELIPVARAGGITHVHVTPVNSLWCGQSSLIQLAGWTAPQMTRRGSVALAIHWPQGAQRRERLKKLQQVMATARRYAAARDAEPPGSPATVLFDPRYEALRPVFNGELPLLIYADTEQQIADALRFTEQEKVRWILCGGASAWKFAIELKQREIPVIVGPVMRAPAETYDPFDAPYTNPARLYEAGVKFCIRSHDASNSRNVPFEAAMAVAYGLPVEAALRAVTLSAAEILGVAHDTGSITPGKRADLVVLDGSPLQITSQVRAVFIAGQPFLPESRQTRFYEKYQRRLQLTQPAAR